MTLALGGQLSWRLRYYFLHLTDEEIEAQKWKWPLKILGTPRSQDAGPRAEGLYIPRPESQICGLVSPVE